MVFANSGLTDFLLTSILLMLCGFHIMHLDPTCLPISSQQSSTLAILPPTPG